VAAKPVRPSVRLRILLAEDNKLNQKYALALLGSAGHEVTAVENGHEAVDAVRATSFDVILMDVQMPLLDGLQATRQIRAMPAPASTVPIIMLTANAMSGAREQYLAAGADDYIAKPVRSDVLLARLAEIKKTPPDMSPEEFREFVALSRSEIDEHMLQLLAHHERGNVKAVGTEAHALVGTAGNIGAVAVSDAARALENACKLSDTQPVPQLVLALRNAVSEAFAAIAPETGREPDAIPAPEIEKGANI
jgi:CheY-like chemotaxis protein